MICRPTKSLTGIDTELIIPGFAREGERGREGRGKRREGRGGKREREERGKREGREREREGRERERERERGGTWSSSHSLVLFLCEVP